jgi:integrase
MRMSPQVKQRWFWVGGAGRRQLWLKSLTLSPKSRAHVRNMLYMLLDFAMWAGVTEVGRNPMELVVVRGATKRQRKPRSLTVEQFQELYAELKEPFQTIALMCVCFGLRISECLALKWSDLDWLKGTLKIERSIVEQHVDDVKTEDSRMSKLFRNVPIVNYLEMSPFVFGVLVGMRTEAKPCS